MNFVPLVEPARRRAQARRPISERLAELESEIKALESKKDPTSQTPAGRAARELAAAQAAVAAAGPAGLLRRHRRQAGRRRRSSGGAIPAVPGPVVPRGVPRFAFLDGEPSAAVSAQEQRPARAGRLADAARPSARRPGSWSTGSGSTTSAGGSSPRPSNFGLRGEPPTHPELLDWLAARFVAGGWSIKAMHREILLSETYQLSSDLDRGDAAIDPENRWLWRFPRRRLDAESIRDAMLAVSGRARSTAGPARIRSRRSRLALDPARPVQGGLSDEPPQRLPDDPAPGEAPVPGALRRPDTNASTDVRGRVDRPAPGSLPHEQPVRAGTGRRPRSPPARRRGRPARRIDARL